MAMGRWRGAGARQPPSSARRERQAPIQRGRKLAQNRRVPTKDVAHISFEGGGLIIPAKTPYQRQLLFEHLEVSAKRHGGVRLEINGKYWTISTNNGADEACSSCSRGPHSLTYRFDGQGLCGPCARHALH